MNNNAFIRIKSRIYEYGNILTWLSVIFIISLALALRSFSEEDIQSNFLFILPGVAAFAILTIVFTKSALTFFGNIMAYAFVGVIAFSVTMAAVAYSPSGLLSGVWLTTILAGVFGTLALSYIIRSSVNPHHLAALSAVVNVLTVMLSLLAFAYISPDSTISAETLALRLSILGLVVSLIISSISILVCSRAYKTSFSKNKVLAKNWLEDKDFEDSTIENIEGIVGKKGYSFSTFKFNNKRNGYGFKDNKTVLFVPLSIAFKETEMTKGLAKNAKVRKKTFDKIIISVINRFSGVYTLPTLPMLIVFVVPENSINRVLSYKLGDSVYADSVLFMPVKQIANWIDDIEKGNSRYVAVFPDISEKELAKREEFFALLNDESPLTKSAKRKMKKQEKAKQHKNYGMKVTEHTDVNKADNENDESTKSNKSSSDNKPVKNVDK